MERDKRLFKTTLLYFIGTFGSKVLVFFLLPLYSYYLSTEQYGSVNLTTNLLSLLGPIFSLQITDTIFRFLCSSNSEEDKKKYITSSFVVLIIGMFSFLIIYIPISVLLNFQYTIIFLLYFIFNYFSLYFQQILRGLKKNIDYTITGVLSTIVQLLINIFFIKFIYEKSIFLSAIVASLSVIIFSLIKIGFFKYLKKDYIDKKVIKDMLKYSLPLIPNQISWWFNETVGLYILKIFRNSSEAGILSFANKFPSMLTIVNSIFLLAWTESSIMEFNSKDKNEYYSKNFSGYSILIFVFAIIILPFIKIYYALFIAKNYVASLYLIPILIIAMIFNSLTAFLGTMYTASMKTKEAFKTTFISALVNIVLDIILIRLYGVLGYAVANAVSYIFFFIIRKISVNKIVKIKINYKSYIPYICLLVVSIVVFYLGNTILNMIFLIVILLYFFIKNGKKIIGIFKLLPSSNKK